jgi:hypothetical protein
MKIFQIEQAGGEQAAKIVEPQPKADGQPSVVYAGQGYVALLSGKFGKGTVGVSEVDHTDPDVRAAIAASIRASVVDLGELDGPLLDLYAQMTAPSLEEARADAFAAVKLRHADMLRLLSGDASVEERDTWPNQKDWVGAIRDCGRMLRLISVVTAALPDTTDDMQPLVDELNAELAASAQKLEGLLTEAEIAQIEGAGGAPSDVMVQKITQKVAAMDLLIQKATRVRRTATAGLTDAASVEEIGAIITQAEQDAETAKGQYLAAIGAA